MEIVILEQTKNRLRIEVIGEDHTLCNALRKELWEDKDVEVAGYNMKHPLISEPEIIVETKSGNPKATEMSFFFSFVFFFNK